jgi:hypothetical protein
LVAEPLCCYAYISLGGNTTLYTHLFLQELEGHLEAIISVKKPVKTFMFLYNPIQYNLLMDKEIPHFVRNDRMQMRI